MKKRKARRQPAQAPEGLVVPKHRYTLNARTRAAIALSASTHLTPEAIPDPKAPEGEAVRPSASRKRQVQKGKARITREAKPPARPAQAHRTEPKLSLPPRDLGPVPSLDPSKKPEQSDLVIVPRKRPAR